MIPLDITNNRYTRLRAIRYDESSKKTGHAKWICQCDCGNTVSVRASHLKTGNARSCGCLAREIARIVLTNYTKSKKHTGKGNPQWKGNGTKHSAIHSWLSRHYIKVYCESCGTQQKLEWSLKSGYTHSHNIKHYQVLCRSCHMKYDYKHKMR